MAGRARTFQAGSDGMAAALIGQRRQEGLLQHLAGGLCRQHIAERRAVEAVGCRESGPGGIQ